MTPTLIALETQDFVAASRLLRLWVAEPLQASTDALSRALDGCAAMAGSDPGELAWAASYDCAARTALNAAADAINAVNKLATMFAKPPSPLSAATAPCASPTTPARSAGSPPIRM